MALFGLKYYGELRSKHQGIIWRVEIAQRGYVGDSEEMTFCGSDPIKVTWEKRGDDFYVPVKASEASVTILCKDNFHYMGLFTADARYYRMSIFRDGQLYWRGFLSADLYSEKFTSPPYEVTIKAVDGFNLLKNIIRRFLSCSAYAFLRKMMRYVANKAAIKSSISVTKSIHEDN